MTQDPGNARVAPEGFENDPADPDIVLITRYLAGESTAEENAEIDRRMEDDEAFYMKVAPIVKMWTLPVKYADLIAAHEAAAQRPATAAPSAWEYPWADAPGRKPGEEGPERKPRISEPAPERTPRIGEPALGYAPATDHAPSDIERLLDRARWERAVDKGKLPLEHRGLWPYLFFSPKAWGMAAVVALGVFAGFRYGKNEGMKDIFPQLVARKAQADAKVAKMIPSAVPVVVRAGESTYVLGRIGSKVVRAVIEKDSTITAVLEGEAYYDVRKETKKVVVNVGHVVIDLAPGTYAIRCETGSDQVLVTVGRGSATIRQYLPKAVLTLQGGEHGRAIKGMSPERTRGGEGYPALEPPSAIAP